MADSVVGALRVVLGLDAGEFYEGLTAATGAVKGFVTLIGGAYGAAAGAVTGLVLATNAARDQIKKLDDLQRDSNLPTEELQRLAFAAKALGIEVDPLVKSLKALQDNMEKGEKEGKKFWETLKKIGIEAEDASGKDKTRAQLFSEIIDKLATYRDGTNKAAISNTLLGESGGEITKALQDGSLALEDAKMKAQEYGAVVGGDATQATLEFDKQLKLIGASKDIFFSKINSVMIPALADMAEKFGLLGKAADEYKGISVGIDVITKAVSIGFTIMGSIVASTISLIGNLASAIVKLFNRDWTGALEEAKSALKNLVGVTGIGATVKAVRELFEKTDPGRIGKFSEAMRQLQRARRPDAPKTEGDEDEEQEKSKLASFEERIRKKIELYKEERNVIGQGTAEKARSLAIIEFESTLRKNNITLTEEQKKKTLELIDTMYQEAKATEQTKRAWDTFWEGMDIIRNALGSAFDKLLDGTFKLKDALRDLVKQFAKMAINKAFLALFGSSSSPGLFNIAGLFGLGGGKAGGGDVNAGTVYPVGENGPELFAPRVPGQIISNSSVRAMGQSGGGGLSVSINAPGADAAQLMRVQQEVRALNETFERRVMATNRNAQVRNLRPA